MAEARPNNSGGGGGGGHSFGGGGGHSFGGSRGMSNFRSGPSAGSRMNAAPRALRGGDRGSYRGRANVAPRYSGDRPRANGKWRHKGHGHHKHHRHGKRVIVGGYWPYYYGDYYYYSDNECDWLYRRAIRTGSPYWWDRYYDCID